MITSEYQNQYEPKMTKIAMDTDTICREIIYFQSLLSNSASFSTNSQRSDIKQRVSDARNNIHKMFIPYDITIKFSKITSELLKKVKQAEKKDSNKENYEASWKMCTDSPTEIILPAGSYFIGCLNLVLKGEEGNAIYNQINKAEGFYTNGKYYIGIWKDFNGIKYGMDVGNIGIVPIELCNLTNIIKSQIKTFNNCFRVKWYKYSRMLYMEDSFYCQNLFEIDLDDRNGEYFQ